MLIHVYEATGRYRVEKRAHQNAARTEHTMGLGGKPGSLGHRRNFDHDKQVDRLIVDR
jgi:hypothetical protein